MTSRLDSMRSWQLRQDKNIARITETQDMLTKQNGKIIVLLSILAKTEEGEGIPRLFRKKFESERSTP